MTVDVSLASSPALLEPEPLLNEFGHIGQEHHVFAYGCPIALAQRTKTPGDAQPLVTVVHVLRGVRTSARRPS